MFFGGIQIIAAGSSTNFLPYPTSLIQVGSVSRVPIFESVFPHHMVLDEVVRQCEKDLIKAINEFCDGTPSKETLKLVEELKRPLPADVPDKALYIFGTNFNVNFYNYDKLSMLPGNMKIYQAKDKCPVKHLNMFSTHGFAN